MKGDEAMKLSEWRRARRMRVALDGGLEVEVRKLSPLDVLAAGGNPELAALLSRRESGPSAGDVARLRSFAGEVAVRAALRPRILSEAREGGDALALEELGTDELLRLMGEIFRFSGFTREAAESLAPLSAGGASSNHWTPPPGATAAAPGNCSGRATPSPPSASTSHAPAPDGEPRDGDEGRTAA